MRSIHHKRSNHQHNILVRITNKTSLLEKINFNGNILASDQALFQADNRAFRYGDGLFETIRMFDGQLPFWSEHWRRFSKGANYLHVQELEDPDFYKDEIYKLCGNTGNFRIRLNLFRKGAGLYTPQDMTGDFLIEASPLEANHFELNTSGLKIDLCHDLSIPRHPLSNFKTLNSLPYVLASIYKKENKLDDCLLLNDRQQIVEASSSNLFILKGKQLLTPKLSSGCKDGTMRRVLIRIAKKLGLTLVKKKIQEQDLLDAEEIWLTNAIQGIRWVGEFQGQAYQQYWAEKCVFALNQSIASL